jgi:hypothetical protein
MLLGKGSEVPDNAVDEKPALVGGGVPPQLVGRDGGDGSHCVMRGDGDWLHKDGVVSGVAQWS